MYLQELIKRENRKAPIPHTECSERWANGNWNFHYYKFNTPEHEFSFENAGIFLTSPKSMHMIWALGELFPITKVTYKGQEPFRAYNISQSMELSEVFRRYSFGMPGSITPQEFIKDIVELYSRNETRMQEEFERYMAFQETLKPSDESLETHLNDVYSRIIAVRDEILEQAKKVPNIGFANTIGTLPIKP